MFSFWEGVLCAKTTETFHDNKHALPTASPVCSGSSTSATKTSLDAPKNKPHHVSCETSAKGCFGHLLCMTSFVPVRKVYNADPNKRRRGRSRTRWADSIKHDFHSAGLNTTIAVKMVFDTSLWKAFVGETRVVTVFTVHFLNKNMRPRYGFFDMIV